MDKDILTDLYKKISYEEKEINESIIMVEEMESYLFDMNRSFETVEITGVKAYINNLIKVNKNSLARILAISRYFYLINRHDIYIYFTSILGGIGVVDSIKERIVKYEGIEMKEKIFNGIVEPPLGTAIDEMPIFTEQMMIQLEKHLPKANYRKILAGNNHRIPRKSILGEKKEYEESDTMDNYLEQRHKRKVMELQEYCDKNKVWFEQTITQNVVDYVKSNQEILAAVKEGNKLYVTKIPYDVDKYLAATDPTMKRYYACHCSFAREAILNQEHNISADWCYCSGGFAKFPFEVLLGKELEVEMLASALKGDEICRFAITINEDK